MATPLQGTELEQKADRWLAFAGLMLILAGALDVLSGIHALSAQDTAFDTLFFDNDLESWGWFYLILGVVLVVAGFAVFARAHWAIVFGIVVALVGATINFFWIFVFPIAALVLVSVNVLVAYALTMYGLQAQKRPR
ncbi:MAG: DUF7144 family membrane protein [Gaiellaceae bacterium]